MTPTRQILALLVRETFGNPPAGLTADELAARLFPLPPLPSTWAPGQRREVLGAPALAGRPGTKAHVVGGRLIPARRAIPAVPAIIGTREIQRRENVARVSRSLGELVRRGYVAPLRPPDVAEWFVAAVRRNGSLRDTLSRLTMPAEPPMHVLDAWEAMVREYEQSPGVWRPRPTGAAQETYRALVAHGVFVAPSMRWATEKGRKLVESWETTA